MENVLIEDNKWYSKPCFFSGYGGDRSRDPNSTVQQLMMAAAAGGMPQEQIAQAISALGLNRVRARFFIELLSNLLSSL